MIGLRLWISGSCRWLMGNTLPEYLQTANPKHQPGIGQAGQPLRTSWRLASFRVEWELKARGSTPTSPSTLLIMLPMLFGLPCRRSSLTSSTPCREWSSSRRATWCSLNSGNPWKGWRKLTSTKSKPRTTPSSVVRSDLDWFQTKPWEAGCEAGGRDPEQTLRHKLASNPLGSKICSFRSLSLFKVH